MLDETTLNSMVRAHRLAPRGVRPPDESGPARRGHAQTGSAPARPAAAPPGRVAAAILRTPAGLYEAGLGWILGHRFLALTHRGRRTGRLHTTVLEVVRWRGDVREAVVVSGFGPRAQWYRNVMAGGAEAVCIGRLRFRPEVRALSLGEAAAVLADYERRNRIVAPIVRAVLARLTGLPYDGSPEARTRIVRELPMLAFTAAGGDGPRSSE